jgi:two-component system sensor histidine kinase SenX3
MVVGQSLTNAAPGSENPPDAAQRQLVDALLSSPFDPVLLLDAAGNVEAFNRAAESEFGLDSALGQPAAAFEALAPLLQRVDDHAAHNAPPVVLQSGSGRAFLVLSNMTSTGGTLFSLRDITDWRHLNAAQVDVMHVVSHDLRSPLTAAKGLVEMMVEGYFSPLSGKQQEAAEKMALSIYGMVAVVDNLQDAGRFDPKTGFYSFEPTPVDLAGLAHKITNGHQLSAEIQHITLTLALDEHLPIVVADRLMLESALSNLLDNAIKFSEPESTVEVEVRSEGRSVVFVVRDGGPGIEADDQERIFERSVRVAKPGQKRVRGSGLGLYIVKSVAERHGGDVWVESKPGAGSTFHLRIPVRAPQPTH